MTNSQTVELIINGERAAKTLNELQSSAKVLKQKLSNLDPELDAAKIDKYKAKLTEIQDEIPKVAKGIGVWREQTRQVGLSIQDLGKGAFWLAIIQKVYEFASAFIAVNSEVAKVRKEVSLTTGESGANLDVLTAKVQGISKAFDKDFNEVLKTSNALSKNLGITQSEALDLIEKGFVSGKANQEDYLNNIYEYSSALSGAKIGAEEFVAIIAQQGSSGVKDDYGIDAIKEFGVISSTETEKFQKALQNLEKQTNSTFAVNLVKDLDSGKVSTTDAMKTVATEIAKLDPASAAAKQAVAEIFGSKGEDVGVAYIQSLSKIETNLDNLIDVSNEYTQANLATVNSEKALALAQSELVALFTSSNSAVGSFVNNALTLLFRGITSVVEVMQPLLSSFNSFISLPVAETIRKEQTELNVLVSRITTSNISQTERNKLITELQSKYPGFLANMNAESATNQQIADRLKNVNIQYEKKIQLAVYDEKLNKNQNEAVQKGIEIENKKQAIEEELLANARKFGAENKFIEQSTNKTLEEKIRLLQKIGGVGQYTASGLIGDAKEINELQAEQNAIIESGKKVIEQKGKFLNDNSKTEIENLTEVKKTKEQQAAEDAKAKAEEDKKYKQSPAYLEMLQKQQIAKDKIAQDKATADAKKKAEDEKKIADELAISQKIEDLNIKQIRNEFDAKEKTARLNAKREEDSVQKTLATEESKKSAIALIQKNLDLELENIKSEREKKEKDDRDKQTENAIKQAKELNEIKISKAQAEVSKTETNQKENPEAYYQARKILLDAQLQADLENNTLEIENLELRESKRLAIISKSNAEQIKLDLQRENAKKNIQNIAVNTSKGFLDLGIALLGQDEAAKKKNAGAIKAFSVSKILVDLALEIAGYMKSEASVASFGILGGIQSALAATRAFGAISQINSQKFASGGLLHGNSHAFGGIRGTGSFANIEVEGNEFITRKSASLNNLNALQTINAFGSSVRFAAVPISHRFADGGVLPNTTPSANALQALQMPDYQANFANLNDTFLLIGQKLDNYEREKKVNLVYSDVETTQAKLAEIRNY